MRSWKNITLVLLVAALRSGAAAGNGGPDTNHQNPPAAVTWKGTIMPVIKRYCLPCHSEENMNPSGLYLTSFEEMMKGGRHGTPVVSGKPDSSLIVQKLGRNPPFGDRMPLRSRKPFPADTLELIRRWIASGARKN